jgi:hypothetical protein
VLTVDINHHTGSGTYASWVVNVGGVTPATSVAWGSITGTLSTQTDLQNALDLKLAATTAATTYYPLVGNPSGFLTSAPVTSVAGRTGAITLAVGDVSNAVSLDGTQTISGAKTFTNAALTLGNSTATSTINIGTGVTASGSVKNVNIGSGAAGGSTVNISIGEITGGTVTALYGKTIGVTRNANDNGIDLATTEFVVGQAASATPLVNGTAAVGTSLRYARQDHVHGTDTTRAPLASPALTGTPTAPTATLGTNTTQIATTAFVLANAPAAPVTSVAGRTGAVVLANTDISGLGTAATFADTAFLKTANNLSELTATASTARTNLGLGTMATATAADYSTTTAANGLYYPLTGNPSGFLTTAPVTSVAGRTGAITLANTDISGLGTMSTATAADYSTTTAANGLYYPLSSNPAGYLTTAPVTSVAGRTGAITLAVADVSGAAPLASPTFTGTVTIPTGASIAGFAPLASPALTGTPTAPTATGGTNTTQIATTAFVTAAIPGNNVKAWVNFNGTGTVAIRASMNVSSITDNGSGDYTVNFTTAMTDANYAMSGFAGETAFTVGVTLSSWGTYTQTTSAFRLKVYYSLNTVIDTANILATFIR